MSASLKLTSASALQAYIRTYQSELIGQMFHGFKTGDLITPHEGVKGQKILTESLLGTLIQPWAKTFDPTADAFDFKPRTLQVYPVKIDLQIYPQEFEETYLGMARRPGFQPNDLPFERYLLDRVIEKKNSEKETGIWQAVRTSPYDTFLKLFDGFLEIIADEVTAGNLTTITTSAHTNSNAVANAESVHAGLAPQYQDMETYMFCSVNFARLYQQNYRADYGKYVQKEQRGAMEMIRLDVGNCYLVPLVGMGTSSRLIVTPKNNLHYGYDLASDDTFIRVEEDHRALDFMMDFKFGCQIGIVSNNILRVNNLT